MNKKELVRIIREVVKREIKSAVKSEINEALNILEHKKEVAEPVKKYSENVSLNEVLEQTARSTEFEPYPEVSPQQLRSQFAAMQGGMPNAQMNMTNHNGVPVNPSTLQKDGLGKALTRDYSELVKRFKK